ncbi:HNH endonuclease [Escherichia coli]
MAKNDRIKNALLNALTMKATSIAYNAVEQGKSFAYALSLSKEYITNNQKSYQLVDEILTPSRIDIMQKHANDAIASIEARKAMQEHSSSIKAKGITPVYVKPKHPKISHVAKQSQPKNLSLNMKYTAEQLRALASGKPLPVRLTETPVEISPTPIAKNYVCPHCNQEFTSPKKRNKHIKKVHPLKLSHKPVIRSASIEQEIRDHKQANVAALDHQLKAHRSKEALKAALREQLAPSPTDEVPRYNVEAYRLAIRTMPQSEAYKLAKDNERSKAFLESINNRPEKPIEHFTLPHVTESITEDEKPSQTIPGNVDPYKPTKVGEKLIQRAKQERLQREAIQLQDVEDRATYSIREVKTRSNQADFAKRVAANFNHHCCITGSTEPLEAAHIEPLSVGDNNNTSNGLLLIVCLHRLLDAGKMAINPSSLTVHFSKDCNWFGVGMFEGKKISLPRTKLNNDGLLKLWNKFEARK